MRPRSHQLLRRTKRTLRRHSRRRDGRHRLNATGDDAALGTAPAPFGADASPPTDSPVAGAPIGHDRARR